MNWSHWASSSSKSLMHGSTRRLICRKIIQMAIRILQLVQVPLIIQSSRSWQLKKMKSKESFSTARMLIWTTNSQMWRLWISLKKWLERTLLMMSVFNCGRLLCKASTRKYQKQTLHMRTTSDPRKLCLHGAPLPRLFKRCWPNCRLKRGLRSRKCSKVTWQACLKAEWMQEPKMMPRSEERRKCAPTFVFLP